MENFSNNQEKKAHNGIHESNSKRMYAILIIFLIIALLLSRYFQTFRMEKTYAGPKKIQIDKSDNIYINLEKRIYKFDDEGNKLLEIGEFGIGSSPFDGYIDFSVDENENIYVADSKNQEIYVYNKDGDMLSSFGRFGLSEGEFRSIIKISVDKKENIYVLDMYNSRVQAFSNEGKFLWLYNIGTASIPDEITIDKKGRVIVIDTKIHNIYIISDAGYLLKTLCPYDPYGSEFLGYGGIIVADTSNNYIFADSYTPYIWEIDSTGNVERLNLDFLKKEKIAIADITSDESDNLWVVDEERFLILTIKAKDTIHSFSSNNIGILLEEVEGKWKRVMLTRRIYVIFMLILVFISLVLLVYKKR